MKTVRTTLEQAGIESATSEARLIVEHVAGPAARVGGEAVSDDAVRQALDLARRRAGGAPLQYLTGKAHFRYLELDVGPGVLIPRPETEVVAERAMARLAESGTVVDVGTGSGAIALSIAHERRDARILATEIDRDALEWARRNLLRLKLDVELIECDLLSGLPADCRREIDVIVSNPPYVAISEHAGLPPDVIDHEPKIALFAGERGTGVIERLVAEAREWLKVGGWLVLEISPTHAADVAGILIGAAYDDVSVAPDLTGRARIAEGRYEQ